MSELSKIEGYSAWVRTLTVCVGEPLPFQWWNQVTNTSNHPLEPSLVLPLLISSSPPDFSPITHIQVTHILKIQLRFLFLQAACALQSVSPCFLLHADKLRGKTKTEGRFKIIYSSHNPDQHFLGAQEITKCFFSHFFLFNFSRTSRYLELGKDNFVWGHEVILSFHEDYHGEKFLFWVSSEP